MTEFHVNGMYINANLNCAVPVESPIYKTLKMICCHYCDVTITEPEILLKFGELSNKFNVVKPACEDCPDFITQRPKKIQVVGTRESRKRQRETTKLDIKNRVKKRLKRSKDVQSVAEIAWVKSTDTEAVAKWLDMNITVFFRLVRTGA